MALGVIVAGLLRSTLPPSFAMGTPGGCSSCSSWPCSVHSSLAIPVASTGIDRGCIRAHQHSHRSDHGRKR